MKSLLQRLNPRKVAIIIGTIILLLVLNRILSNRNTEEVKLPEEKVTPVTIIEFGHWSPDEQREITGTILSGTDIDVRAEVSGTIEKTFVTIGDTVKAGQVLATFQRKNDATQISYENLLQQLAVAKIQAQSSVLSAEIALDTTEQKLDQTRINESQNYSRTFDLLKTQTRNAESQFRSIVDWADTILLVSTSARANVNYVSQQIGKNNAILRQRVKNQIEEVLRERDRVDQERLPKTMSDDEVLRLAKNRLQLLQDAQGITYSLLSLIQGTPITGSFSATNKASYASAANSSVTSIDTISLSLETQIEAAKSEQGRNRLSVLGSETAVQNAKSSLTLAQAQSQSQVTQLETQLRLARNSQSDLTVLAPFGGTITGSSVLPFDQIKAGDILFSLVGKDIKPKINATITHEELLRMQANPDTLQAKLEDGTLLSLSEFQISGKLNRTTQKLEVDFPLETLPPQSLLGSFVKILLPINGIAQNLLPISAISFEPDGEEVLLLENGKGKRVKITAGNIVSSAIEILDGLEDGDSVVRYRNRAHAGEKLEISNK